MSWIDISHPLNKQIAVWPGDKPFTYEASVTKEQSGSVNIGEVTMSVHTGTHIDAPFHFDDEGRKVIDLDIDVYVGPARVIDVSRYEAIGAEELAAHDLDGAQRLLLKTSASTDPTVFPDSIPYLQADASSYLEKKGIRLVGLNVPSVDALDSKDLPAHHALFDHGVHILENVNLDHVQPGNYQLIALPLALEEADGSPVRAVLKPIETNI